MRIACLQFNPQVGDVDNNMTRADRVLSKGDTENLDLIVLPEMAFSGYSFKSLSEIHSSLEPTASGISSLWARTTALKHNCHVSVGYPEKADVSHKWPADPEYYNAAVVVGPDGENAAHYRKAQLYYTDETWALEGNKGFYGDHITGLGQTAAGICMDINPYKFEAPWSNFEFANHILDCDANVVIFNMAWLTLDDQREFTSLPHEPDLSTLTYWAMRLEPVIRAESDEEVIVVFANRCGTEGETLYAGTSAVIGIRGGEVNVYGLLGRSEKKLLVVDTNQAPIAKLMMTPRGIKLVRSSSGGQGSAAKTTPSQSSTRQSEESKGNGASDGSRDRGSTPSRSKETAPVPVSYDPPRQSLHRLAPVPPALNNSPSLTPDTPRKSNVQPPKLTIPDTGPRSLRKSETAGTPVRKNPNDPFEPQVTRPASRLPDSAVVLSAVERHRQSILSPADSAIGRATPDNRSRKSSRRSEHKSPRHKDALRLDTVLTEEVLEEEEEISRALTLKDSPVMSRPDASVLSNWLDTLPGVAELEPVPGTSPAGLATPSGGREVVSGCSPVCHACGQEVPTAGKDVVGSKGEKKRALRTAASKQEVEVGVRRSEAKGSSVRAESEARRSGERISGTRHRGGAPHPVEVPRTEDLILQLRASVSRDAMRGTPRAEEAKGEDAWVLPTPKAFDVSSRFTFDDENEDGHTEVENVKESYPSPEEAPANNASAGSLPAPTQIVAEDKEVGTELGGTDLFASRAGIVPPSGKGVEKVVVMSIRPSSVAW